MSTEFCVLRICPHFTRVLRAIFSQYSRKRDAIKAAWDEDLTAAKLECAYRLLTPVMGLINDKNGGNNFTLPHTGLRKAMREDGWDI